MSALVVTVNLEVEIDERTWANIYGAGDAYNRAEAQQRRSLVADVESYVLNQVAQSAARDDGAILSVDIAG